MNFNDFLKDELENDPVLKREYDALAPEYELIEAMIRARLESGLTQGELARRCGMRQSNISRLERGCGNPTFKMLKKIANAMDSDLVVDFRKREELSVSTTEKKEVCSIVMPPIFETLFNGSWVGSTETKTQSTLEFNLVGENV